MLLATVSLFAQNLPPRNNYVLHVYVDPTFGDDQLAYQLNPSWQNAAVPFSFHPDATRRDLNELAPPSACDLTVFTDNPFAYYNPSSGNGAAADPGYPRSATQIPTRLSNPTSGIINPPGIYLDMNLGGVGGTGPRLDTAYSGGSFGPFAPCGNTTSSTFSVDLSGVGDTSAGCPDEVPDIWQGVGIRINCMLGVNPQSGFGTSNLQTFLVYSRTQAGFAAAQRSTSSTASSAASEALRPPTREELREGLRRLLNSSTR